MVLNIRCLDVQWIRIYYTISSRSRFVWLLQKCWVPPGLLKLLSLPYSSQECRLLLFLISFRVFSAQKSLIFMGTHEWFRPHSCVQWYLYESGPWWQILENDCFLYRCRRQFMDFGDRGSRLQSNFWRLAPWAFQNFLWWVLNQSWAQRPRNRERLLYVFGASSYWGSLGPANSASSWICQGFWNLPKPEIQYLLQTESDVSLKYESRDGALRT